MAEIIASISFALISLTLSVFVGYETYTKIQDRKEKREFKNRNKFGK